MSDIISRAEVAKHNTIDDLWLVVNERVYDLSKFVNNHPGGQHTLLEYAGKDATEVFYALHLEQVLNKYSKYCIGVVKEKAKFKYAEPKPGELELHVPFSEPAAFTGHKSPYYNESHWAFRRAVRAWLTTNMLPNADQWEKSGKFPKKIIKEYAQAGLFASLCVPYPSKYTDVPPPGGVDPKKYDLFHEMIMHEETSRLGYPWLLSGIGTGFIIGLPPVKYFAKPHIRDRVMREVINGEKRICLAISEPYAGSDVSGIRCRAVKSADGSYYTVTGIKKWITTSITSDYFTTATRTGKKGMSVFLIPKGPGVTVRKQQVIGGKQANAAGTSWVVFENVKVPAENLIGVEHQGFKVLMYNFNHERWYIAVIAISMARSCVRDCMKWVFLRKAFGRVLAKQPVVRQKLAHMARQVEAAHAWQESLTHQMNCMTPREQNQNLGGPMALFKLHAARTLESVASEAVQLMGGRGLTQTGHGAEVSRIFQQVKYVTILGGVDAIMADLGVKQAFKKMKPEYAKL